MAARGMLFSGDLFIARFVGGVLQDYQGPYECTKFEIKPNIEIKELISRSRAAYGQPIESVALPQPAELTVDLPEVNKESLAIALLGTTTVISQSAASLTDEVVTITKLDTWYPTSKHSFTTMTMKTSSDVVMQEGVDFIVDKQQGWVKVLSTNDNSVVDGNTVKVSGAYAAKTGYQVAGMTDSNLRARFKLVGKNFVDGLGVEVIVYEAIIAADSAFDFMQEDFASISLPGRMKVPAGYTEPFIVRQMTT